MTDALLDSEAVAIDCPGAEAAAVLLRGSISLGGPAANLAMRQGPASTCVDPKRRISGSRRLRRPLMTPCDIVA